MARVFSDQKANLDPSFFQYSNEPQLTGRSIKDLQENIPVWSLPTDRYKEYHLTEQTKQVKNFAYEALYGQQQVGEFSLLFFSEKNLNEVQKLIIYNVWLSSGKKFKIDPQDPTELKIVMKSVYLQFSRVPSCISMYTTELKRLNRLATEQILPNLLSNIEQYIHYLKDASSPQLPMDRAVNMSTAGTKVNRSVTDVFFGVSPAEFNLNFRERQK